MRVLVTGGTGFIGQHLVSRLRREHEVLVWDTKLSSSLEGVQYSLMDVRFPALNEPVDVIYHLAGISGIQACEKDFHTAFDVNVNGTVRMLELASVFNSKFISVTTSDLSLKNNYSFTKSIANRCCQYFSEQGLDYASAKLFSVYGPGQPETSVIGSFERQRRSKEPLTVYGGQQRRDFIHVSDVVEGLARLLNYTGEYEFGWGCNYGIMEVAKMFELPIVQLPEREYEIQESLADIAATQAVLEWRPTMLLEDYIESIKNETR